MNRLLSDRDSSAPVADVDAHAFERFVQGHDALDVAAATWAVRRRDGLSPVDRAALQAWLDADPQHAAALEDMAATTGQVRQLSSDDVAAIKRRMQSESTSRPHPASSAPRHAPERPRWRFHLGPLIAPAAAAVLVVALVGAGWTGWDSWRSLPTFEQAFSTERGQQIVATLPDDPTRGSTVQLDTATRLEARLFRSRREVHLQEGQALFSVHADRDRPFHVWAGKLHITVVGTRFSVRHTTSGLDAGRTVVSVEEGHVRVSRARDESDAASNDATVELVAGQMVTGDDSGGMGPVTRVPTEAVAPWRAGRISFGHTPLAEALAEFERYRSTGLVIKDPAVARLPVGGSYRVQQFGSFVDALPLMLPVRLVTHGEVTEIVLRHP